jgi:general secretion pathway protein B
MSFIHEALKRSERARRLLGASRLEPADAALAPPSRSRWLPWIIVLLVANFGLLAWFGWQALAPDAPARPPPAGEVRSLEREVGGAAPPEAPATTVRSVATEGATRGEVATLDALPTPVRAALPPLHIDAHVWSDDPAQRFAIIDLKRRVVGDALGGGATLVEITADGVVVEVAGQRVSIASR